MSCHGKEVVVPDLVLTGGIGAEVGGLTGGAGGLGVTVGGFTG